MTSKEQKDAARAFVARWLGKGYEKGECQKYWRSLLHDVFGIADPDDWVDYEVQVNTGFTTKFIDAYIPRTKTLIEQKGFTKDLTEKQVIEQALLYVGALPDTMPVRFIVLCNFQEFIILDKHAAELHPVKVRLADLPKKLAVLRFLTEVQQKVADVHDVSIVDERAGRLVGRLYNALLHSYSGEVDERTLECLNMLCVRLVFCAYAEDSGVFPKADQFVNYMRRYDAESFRDRLAQFFRLLNTDYPDRDPDDIPALLEFPYVGSGLFDDEHIRIPRFTDETRTLLLDSMCAEIDWTEINPTIFGAVFESTLSTAVRRKNGMHYTTVENIHRVTDPLFLLRLERMLDEIAATPNIKRRNQKLRDFQLMLSRLRFLDPACGSGNFLTETYIALRRLENRAIMLQQQGQAEFDFGDIIKVTIDQFYGIEIDGFAVSVAQTALWIAESQMMLETEKILHRKIEFLPLRRYAHIVKGNALRMDWNKLLQPGEHFDYVFGNPPFIGYSNQSQSQKSDMLATFVDDKGKPLKTAGKIDYVAAWYWKAAELMRGTSMRTAFVSTNSICQGEQVAAVWKPLKERFGVEIDFAWRTFVWDSKANEKAHVHVVIVGFSCGTNDNQQPKTIFTESGAMAVGHINGYLMDAPDAFVESRTKPLCDVPGMTAGNRPADGGHLIIEAEDYADFTKAEPGALPYIKRFVGAEEFINNKKRYCLWLTSISPGQLRSMPMVYKRVEKCREDRLNAIDAGRRKLAEIPMLFRETQNPSQFLIVPKVSSERRHYAPIGFENQDTIASDLLFIVPSATLYHFGVLTSSVHMAWMRAVAGRLEMRYRYSANIVYNNFPWPAVTDDQRRQIETTAQGILDARALPQYAESSLADLYDPLTMPRDLRKAHEANDAAVMAAYGFPKGATEAEIVSRLFGLYAQLAAQADGKR